MRRHVTLLDIARVLDQCARGKRCSKFIAVAVRLARRDERRWDLVESCIGAIPAEWHDWDVDPAAWVHDQRRVNAGSAC